jgi:hypothetical protein
MFILAALTVICLMPAKIAFAGKTLKVSATDELDKAVGAAGSGDVIEITDDISITHCIVIEGKRLTIRSEPGTYVHTITRSDKHFDELFSIVDSDVIFENIIIDGNRNAIKDQTGPLIYSADSDIALIENAALLNNLGIGVRADNCDFTFDGAAVKNNLGGLWLDDSEFVMTGGEISGNESRHSHGGGVYMRYGKFNMSGGSIQGNRSESTGGGVTIESGSGAMSGGTINDNASFFGGGVFVSDGTFTLSGGTISRNTAEMAGGGIMCKTEFGPAALVISGGSITSNASEGGGGAAVMGDSEFRISGGTIAQNRAKVGGGVFFCGYDKGSKYVMTGGEIVNNEAFGEGASGFYDHTINGAGGGLYQAGDKSSFTLKDGSIKNNIANNGAGVYIEAGKFEMTGGAVINNYARVSDGGIFDRTGKFRQKSGTLGDNADNIYLVPVDKEQVINSLSVGADTGIIKTGNLTAFRELIAEYVLTDREKKAATIGDPAAVDIKAEFLKVEGEAPDTGTDGKGEAARFRVTAAVKIADGEPRNVSKTGKAIPVTIILPKELQGRRYEAVISEGRKTVYDDMDESPETFTVLIDTFSEYSLFVCKPEPTDVPKTLPGGTTSDTSANSKTPSAGSLWILPLSIGLLAAAVWIMSYSIMQKRKME